MDPRSIRWHASEDDGGAIEAALDASLVVERGQRRQQTLELFESFDRGLLRAGRALVRERGIFHVVDANDLRSGAVEGGRLAHPRPVFWWDFEPSPFQQLLRGCLGLRAATALAVVELHGQELRVRNADGKIVVRLWKETATVDGRVIARSLILAPLVGYAQEAGEVAAALSAGSTFREAQDPLAWLALGAVGEAWLPLSSKPALDLDPQETSQAAVTRIAQCLLRAARQNEPGILADIDTEFLHDYRVALRQLRSLLKLIRGVYPADDTRRLRGAFGELASATNRLRDLDVHLLDAPDARALLPPSLRSGLDRLFADLRSERGLALRRLRRTLRSQSYQAALERHAAWLDAPSPPAGPRADTPIGVVASREIRRHHRKVVRSARAITPTTPPEAVHALRIECKRLRYLFELFASLFPRRETRRMVRKLKQVQDILGRFNDCSVQQEFMRTYLASAPDLDASTSAAVGGLMSVLYRSQLEARHELDTRISELARTRWQIEAPPASPSAETP